MLNEQRSNVQPMIRTPPPMLDRADTRVRRFCPLGYCAVIAHVGDRYINCWSLFMVIIIIYPYVIFLMVSWSRQDVCLFCFPS